MKIFHVTETFNCKYREKFKIVLTEDFSQYIIVVFKFGGLCGFCRNYSTLHYSMKAALSQVQ